MSYSLPITPERVLRRVLPNGLTVLLAENQASESVALEGQLLAGAHLEQDNQQGLANLTAMLLRRGTQQRTFLEINQLLDDVGALLSVSGDDTHVNISARSLADDLPLVLDLLSEMLMFPRFDDLDFVKAKGQLLTNLSIYQNDTGYRAGTAFSEARY
ncbi:MAG: insulinase family protein, partial [Anaerolineae bacterium]